MTDARGAAPTDGVGRAFRTTPRRVRAFLVLCEVAAVAFPFLLRDAGSATTAQPLLLTLVVLVLVSVLNVEISRALTGGLERTHQPHKALSAWAFACALLLPTPMLLVVVPLSYAHARWRGLRLPLWKWIGSAAYLVLAGLAAAAVAHSIVGSQVNWMDGSGGRGFVAIMAAAAAFLAVESLLFAGSAFLNTRENEEWLRRTLTSASFYGTEGAVLLIGGLLAAVWTGGSWFVLLLVPIYALAQRAALHEPLRARAQAAAELVTKNDQLEEANRFKIDLMGMLGHEIGNPLTSILGYAQVGADAVAESDVELARSAFAVVERNATQIRTVLREILSTVSSDSGTLVAIPEACPLDPRLKETSLGQPLGRQPEVVCPARLSVLVQPSHLDQILGNLLSNADKYAGGATCISASATGTGQVQICVQDVGPGVPGAFREHLFERFTRHEGTAGLIGTGLGLFITRELARANGGEVTHRDNEPTGSVFVVTLPRARDSE